MYTNLAPLPIRDGVYEQWENIENMWTKYNYEHPALLGVFGMLPGYGVDTAVMKRTYEKVRATWKFDACWGWDFPMAAMTAARLGKPADAIDMFLYNSNQNTFDAHGMASEGKTHYPYMPANGGLLYAVAMMCAGWDGSVSLATPGFPSDGSWIVRWENLSKAP